ncbi:undecaprenyldiphospho-muramoylpentapeptide beta-N-acetylglucosaminyltransferase [Parashewanella curva]|uniref:UDP-N-acetylglucosamine--N-acetylmuramyl-(pentapeptide) pyrophosphoryl-undecaprenol N-acetylglucosamine transferase n=1 Tax=Parashewanella curva TaxID=2338552 RepID=A0A3L8PUE8_9GAMM|nr:undecaprenyldiphospho-muramoylpentapeptide beta-N-acetylglucosaminyltransferase [Parashewanella curva]RLV58946.1 undecaprenyldiphospho-muramoylpentapeptide beta-N-acetylglucosaminyltransferase [Parashewanella curva]
MTTLCKTNKKTVKKRILVMAGGTGGHVFPALAVAKKLANEGWEVLWLGTAERMEAKLVPQHGFNIEFIDIKGVRGNGIIRKLMAPIKIIKAIAQARFVIKAFQPDVVIGMGGFASGPGGIAAKLCGIPLVLHEQNAIPGMTNKLLSKIATKVLCAFEGTFEPSVNAKVVGNPIRAELESLRGETWSIDDKALKVLIVGGSLGAGIFNDWMPLIAAELSRIHSLTLWHQVGKGNLQAVTKAYQKQQQQDSVQVTEFIDDMQAAYQWADVVICRAGALTVSELAMVGKPSILVPYPHAVDDHQTLNANVLVNAGGAFLLPQPIASVELFVEKLSLLAENRAELAAMGKQAKQVATINATEQVAAVCKALTEKEVA